MKEERRTVTAGRRRVTPAMTWDSAVALCDMFSYGGCCCKWERERRRRKWRLGLEDEEGKMIKQGSKLVVFWQQMLPCFLICYRDSHVVANNCYCHKFMVQ